MIKVHELGELEKPDSQNKKLIMHERHKIKYI